MSENEKTEFYNVSVPSSSVYFFDKDGERRMGVNIPEGVRNENNISMAGLIYFQKAGKVDPSTGLTAREDAINMGADHVKISLPKNSEVNLYRRNADGTIKKAARINGGKLAHDISRATRKSQDTQQQDIQQRGMHH